MTTDKTLHEPIIDSAVLGSPGLVLADVRWQPGARDGREAYLEGHLPGAVYVDLDRQLAGPVGDDPPTGQHPLPDPAAFAASMAGLGIGDGTPVVAYDDNGGCAAARLVWLLRAVGHPAAILDGGLAGWDGPLERGDIVLAPATFTVRPWPAARLADPDAVVAHVASGRLLLDAGTPVRYWGESLSIHDRAGHIPGAVNVTWTGNLEGARFLSPGALRARYEEAGAGQAEDVLAYCGSGIAACHALLAMEQAGLGQGRLYPGSWSQWSADPARPVARGRRPR